MIGRIERMEEIECGAHQGKWLKNTMTSEKIDSAH